MPTALLSVSNKDGILEFAKELKALGYDIISSGGTAKTLKENNIDCAEIAEITGFPEILDGRVKTLNPKIHGGILAIRNNANHMKQLSDLGINTIDIVACNLYPFEETSNKIPKPQDKKIAQEIIENIDIGGVTLLRAAAKNYKDVIVTTSPEDYEFIIQHLKDGSASENFKLSLAAKAFRHTAYYDALISNYLTYEEFTEETAIPLKKAASLRYGENPHQNACLYSSPNDTNKSNVITARQIHGKELSYNNYLDLEASWQLVHEFSNPACAIIKHNNPCGCAEYKDICGAYLKALSCDPVSAFGGIIAFNKEVDEKTATELSKLFVECIIAPGYSQSALKILQEKKNIRLLIQNTPFIKPVKPLEYRMISNGMLVQDKDNELTAFIKNITKRPPSTQEEASLEFAWKVSKHVKSNAIVLVRGRQTVGVGAGQMSRIDSLKIALAKMAEANINTSDPLVLASDAFFPFPDVIEEAAKAGVVAVIQPGGSIKDELSVKAADNLNIAMQLTGMRHFKH